MRSKLLRSIESLRSLFTAPPECRVIWSRVRTVGAAAEKQLKRLAVVVYHPCGDMPQDG
jgi:hypothetical protein